MSVMTAHFRITYIWHTTGTWTGDGTFITANLGGTSVSLFFLITGYLFFNKIRHAELNWKKLYSNRIKRIYPLYLFALIIIFLITLYHVPLNTQTLHNYAAWIKKWLMFRMTDLNGFDSSIVIAGVVWTLQYEWAFYLSLPLWHMILHKKKTKPLIWCSVLLLAYYLIKRSPWFYPYALFPLSLPALIWKKEWKYLMHTFPKIVNIYMIAFPISLFFTIPSHWIQMLLTTIAFVFIANGYSYFGILHHTGLRRLGDISYSIYLLHGIVLYLLFETIQIYDFTQSNINIYILLFLPITFILVITVSLISYRWIEQPFMRRKS